MKFLVISQRAIPSPDFSLKNLTGHGRIDIIMRCILSAIRPICSQNGVTIFCYLKGSENLPAGWITWPAPQNTVLEDEISIASKIKENWQSYFSLGSLDELIKKINYSKIALLTDKGNTYDKISEDLIDYLIVLGAQADLSEEDLLYVNPEIFVRLGAEAMLASHAITFFRQLVMI